MRSRFPKLTNFFSFFSKECIFCDKKSASIACSFPDCKFRYHLICGFREFCLFEFENLFLSKCHNHHGITHEFAHTKDEECRICFQPMGSYNPITSILPTCCKRGFIHRDCLIEYANSAGYYFKCILCSSADFRNEAKKIGVFVPDRDANWELESGAYSEIYFKHKFCDVTMCLCPFGRKYTNSGKWIIFKCIHCAATGTHKACFENIDIKKGFECFQCRKIIYKSNLDTSAVNLDETLDIQAITTSSIFSEKLQALREAFETFKMNKTIAEQYDYDVSEDDNESSIPELEKNVVEDSDQEEDNPIFIQRKKRIDERNMRSFMLSRFMNDTQDK